MMERIDDTKGRKERGADREQSCGWVGYHDSSFFRLGAQIPITQLVVAETKGVRSCGGKKGIQNNAQ